MAEGCAFGLSLRCCAMLYNLFHESTKARQQMTCEYVQLSWNLAASIKLQVVFPSKQEHGVAETIMWSLDIAYVADGG